MFMFFGLATMSGCMLGDMAAELPSDIMETMPPNIPGTEDPITGETISPRMFWTTWLATLGAHEARKFLRLLRKKWGNDDA